LKCVFENKNLIDKLKFLDEIDEELDFVNNFNYTINTLKIIPCSPLGLFFKEHPSFK
jgi:hypothetical protein